MVLSSPIVFQVIVLFSASHYASQQKDMAFAETILYLKQCALAGISQSLSSASTGIMIRDELIAATAKMASYEAIYGDETAYHCHMKGVEEMLKMRGGLKALGLDGFLSRLLTFIDTNSAFLLNTHLHLRDSSFPRQEVSFHSSYAFIMTTHSNQMCPQCNSLSFCRTLVDLLVRCDFEVYEMEQTLSSWYLFGKHTPYRAG